MTFSKFEGSARLLWAAIALLPGLLMAQSATISGTVVDAEARYPLLGATVQVLTVPDLVSMADLDGRFTLDNVPLGRHALQVSFIGYEPRVLEGIVVTSGRPVVLSVELQESVVAMEAAEVMATQERPVDDDQPYLERFEWGWAGRTCCGLFIYVLAVGWEIHEFKSADSKNKSAD